MAHSICKPLVFYYLLDCFGTYLLSCDAWSLPTVNSKAIYHQRTYRSILIDVIPVDGGKADDIKSARMTVCNYYNLKEDSLITTAFVSYRRFRVCCAS